MHKYLSILRSWSEMSSANPVYFWSLAPWSDSRRQPREAREKKAFNRGVHREKPQRTPSKSSNVFLFSACFAAFSLRTLRLKALRSPALIDYFAVEKGRARISATGDE